MTVTGNQVKNVAGNVDIGYLIVQDNAVVNLYNLDNKWAVNSIMASGNSVVKLYTDSYVLSNSGGRYGTGYVAGIWGNNVQFYINLGNGFSQVPDFNTQNHIQFTATPEPATILMLALGVIRLRLT